MTEAYRPPPSVSCPPAVPRSYLRFLRVPPRGRAVVAIGSASVWACHTHWHEHRTRYCHGPYPSCPLCEQRSRRDWTAFLVVYLSQLGAPHLIEFFASAYRNCPALAAHDGSLTRAVVVLHRMGDAKNSPLRIEWTGERREGEVAPIEHQSVYLSRLWSCDLAGQGG